MSERALLVAYSLGFIAVLAALGSGPTVFLARRVVARALLAPVVGLAIAASGLTTAALVMPVRIAAWALLVPAAVASAAWAGWMSRRDPRGDLRELAIPAAAVLVGLLIGVAPGLWRGTLGPFAIAVFDTWGYVQTADWLQDHDTGDGLVAGANRYDLSTVVGQHFASTNARIGVETVMAAVSSLYGVSPDATIFAFLAALFALVPAVVWVIARTLGAGRPAAALGALFGLSPAVLTLVGDSTLANLAGLVIAPALLLATWIGVTSGGAELALAAVLGGGLLAVYPEFAVPTLAVAGIGAAAFVLAGLAGKASLPPWQLAGRRLALLVAGVVVAAPHSALRAQDYLREISRDFGGSETLPDRWITLENAGAWAFGVLHVYQLRRFELLSDPKTFAAIVFPLVLAALALLAVVRRPAPQTFFVAAPIAVALVAGLAAYRRYADGHCEYCLWKSLTFMLPFLALALALGAQRLFELARPRRPDVLAVRLAVAGVALAAAAAIGTADAKLIQATHYSGSFTHPDLRDLSESVSRLPNGAHVMIEGGDAGLVSPFDLPSAYYETRELPERRVSFDAVAPATAYLRIDRPPERYYAPDYTHVVTAFTGVRSNRKLLARHGPYSLLRRAPIDVVISRTGWSVDAAGRSRAIPWITRPFQLRISSRRAQRAALRLTLARPAGSQSTLFLSTARRELGAARSRDGLRLCADLALREGVTVLDVEPLFDTMVAVPTRTTESEEIPPLPRALGVRGVEATSEACPPGEQTLPVVRFGHGWHGPEITPEGRPFRWMGTEGTLIVGEEGIRRPRLRLTAVASSFLIPRRLSIRRGGDLLFRRLLPPQGGVPVELELPRGTGRIALDLAADPAARSATAVNPVDTRLLAIALVDARVAR